MRRFITQDISFSFRTLIKHLGFTITAVLTLALGIGATTAIFSVVYAVFEPMPYPKPEQLVMVWSKIHGERNSVAPGDYFEWKRRNTSFQDLNAWSGASFNVATPDRPEQIEGSPRTPGFFKMEGMPMFLGRDFLPEEGEPGRDHVVILSNRMWARLFNSDRELVGKDIRMNGQPYTVVGVLPPGMYDRLPMELWVPLAFEPQQLNNHNAHFTLVMGRLKDGVSINQAQAEMDGIAAQLQNEFPQSNTNWSVSVEPLHLDFVDRATRRNLWLLLGAVGFLLLIACVNVANLLLARGTSRQREVAVRAALGASRLRIFSQFLTESLVLAVIGGVFGVVLAGLILELMKLVMPPVGTMLPSEADIRISVPVLLFTLAVTGISGILFGSAPAWQAARFDLNEVLKTGGRTGGGGARRNALRFLVIAEFSLALTLLATGAMALKGFWNLTRVDLGIRPEHVLTFQLPVPDERLKGPDQIRSYYRQMLSRVEAVPGITKVAVMTGVPARGPNFGMPFKIVGQPEMNPSDRPGAAFQMVTAKYVEALGIRLTKGRSIDEHDTETTPRVAMVNENFVSRYMPGVDPLTQRISVEEIIPGGTIGAAVEWQIVGVYQNVRGAGQRAEYPEINVPFWQNPWPQVSMVLRTEGEPKVVTKSVAAAINSVDPDLPLAGVKTIDEIVSESLAIDRFSMVLFSSFGLLGLILAAVGIYGVMAFGVAQRTHEFGIRMALGAQRSRVVRLVLKEGTIVAVVGALIGLGGAYLVGRAMQSTLYGVGAMDTFAIGVTAGLLMAVALLACLVPAFRASRVEPMTALREE
ncbi:MAG TPA: ABC transporter permease [Pyrinomonadaceae bacterium]|jgi:predicted permease|nr:ABC transporter permease [Pyrinomonadaceae bacterium]